MRSIKSVLFTALVMMVGTFTAWGHTKMTESSPKDGATVGAGLEEIALKFSKPMRLTLVHVRRDTDDRDVPLSGALPTSFESSAKVGVEALPAGTYDVSWIAVSEDGHVMKGSFAFTVGRPPDAGSAK